MPQDFLPPSLTPSQVLPPRCPLCLLAFPRASPYFISAQSTDRPPGPTSQRSTFRSCPHTFPQTQPPPAPNSSRPSTLPKTHTHTPFIASLYPRRPHPSTCSLPHRASSDTRSTASPRHCPQLPLPTHRASSGLTRSTPMRGALPHGPRGLLQGSVTFCARHPWDACP